MRIPVLTLTSKAFRLAVAAAALAALTALLAGCGAPPTPQPTVAPLAEEITYYDWEEMMPQSVLDAFEQEFGVRVNYVTYVSQEEAIEKIRSGEVYDVVVMESQAVPALVDEGLLAEIDYQNVPNIKNISPNFLDLSYDPGNRYTVPYTWGTEALVVRTDLVQEPVTRWADLWDPRYAGQVGIWNSVPEDTFAIALKALGYSANSEDPAELQEALDYLLELKQTAVIFDDIGLTETCAPVLISGEVAIAQGWSYDAQMALESVDSIEYVMPEEGALLWSDNYVIPANSPNKQTAELFINFLLRPEIAAELVNYTYYATANQAALAFVDPEILSDPTIFPVEEDIRNAEIMLPRSAEGTALFNEMWSRFLAAEQ